MTKHCANTHTQTHKHRIIRFNNCIQLLSCVLDIAAIFVPWVHSQWEQLPCRLSAEWCFIAVLLFCSQFTSVLVLWLHNYTQSIERCSPHPPPYCWLCVLDHSGQCMPITYFRLETFVHARGICSCSMFVQQPSGVHDRPDQLRAWPHPPPTHDHVCTAFVAI